MPDEQFVPKAATNLEYVICRFAHLAFTHAREVYCPALEANVGQPSMRTCVIIIMYQQAWPDFSSFPAV